MTLFCERNRTTEKDLRGRFIKRLTKKSIVIQNIRGQVCDRTKDDVLNELVDVNKSKIHFVSILLLS